MICGLILTACTKTEYVTEYKTETIYVEKPVVITSKELLVDFDILTAENSESLIKNVVLERSEDKITGIIPHLTENKTFVINFKLLENSKLYLESTMEELISGTSKIVFTEPVKFVVQGKDKLEYKFTVTVISDTGLPVFEIYTRSYVDNDGNKKYYPIDSKDVYVKASLRIFNGSKLSDNFTSADSVEIKGRGNSTWKMPKKPYRIKFPAAKSLFGFPTDKDWVLLANYADKSLIRTMIAFDIGYLMNNLAYTPRYRSVEVILNGEHIGNYTFTEHQKVAPDRVNVDKVTGRFLEVDRKADPISFTTAKIAPKFINLKNPEKAEAVDPIKSEIENMEKILSGTNFADSITGYESVIDTKSFVDWYIVNEFAKNTDAQFYGSCFMFYNLGEKIKMGPIWDFDLAFGNANYSSGYDPKGWWVMYGPWFVRLFDDPKFKGKVKIRWMEKRDEIKNIIYKINSHASLVELSAKHNFEKWDVLSNYVWPNNIITGSYLNEVAYLKKFFLERYSWMDNEIQRW